MTDAQEPRRENSKCQQTSRADFPHALCTAAGPRHKGVAPSKTKEDDSAVTGFRVSITVQQRRVGLWTGLGTGNNVPCMQQVPATATQGSKRVGSSKCNPSRVYKNKNKTKSTTKSTKKQKCSRLRFQTRPARLGAWRVDWVGLRGFCRPCADRLSSTVLVHKWVGPEERIHPRNIVLGGAGRA